MATVVSKLKFLLALGALTCAFPSRHPVVEPVFSVVRYNPLPVYQLWIDRSLNCAVMLLKNADTATFKIEHDSVNVTDFTWLAVPSERADGGFPCRFGYCSGMFRHDTVFISGQRITDPVVVSHELMHYAIESPGEDFPIHGPPWGLCEFINGS